MHYSILFYLLLAPGAALAGGSIIDITSSQTGGDAVMEIHCTACAPVDDGRTVEHSGVTLMQKQISGESKTVQIDNMMGGSPVRIVRSAYSSADEHAADGVTVFDEQPAAGQHPVDGFIGEPPVSADTTAQVTVEGGGDFQVDEVSQGNEGEQDVDPGSQTSSVDMENAEHDNVDDVESDGSAAPSGGPEILELRPGTTVGPQDQ